MTKRQLRYFWVSIAVLLSLGFLLVVPVVWNYNAAPASKLFTMEDCDRIELGMTERQVEAIFRRQADRQHHPWDTVVFLAPRPDTEPEWEKLWIDKKMNAIVIHFDAKGKVLNKALGSLNWE